MSPKEAGVECLIDEIPKALSGDEEELKREMTTLPKLSEHGELRG